MLFDLQSPGRRRVIKIAYGTLAVLFVVGFIGFGIGTETGGGGILDSITGGGGGGDDNPFEDEIEAAEQRIQQNPKDPRAYAELVALRYQAGNQAVEVDEETGQTTLTQTGEQQLQQGADAWTNYLKLSGQKADASTATLAVQIFATLGDTAIQNAITAGSGQEALSGAEDAVAAWTAAADAQQILVERRPNASGYSNLAFFYYRSGQIAQGDRAAAQAVAAAKGAEKEQIQQQLKQSKQEGQRLSQGIEQLRTAQQAPAPGGAGGETNPFEGLGGGGLGGGGLSSP